MSEMVNDKEIFHVEGLALGYGLCAAKHLDIVLVRTTQLQNIAHAKTKKKFFGIGGGKQITGAIEKKCLCIRTWGWITRKTPPKLIISRMDAHIFTHLIKIMREAKNNTLKLAIIETIELIAEAMNDAYEVTQFQIKKRDVLIEGMLQYIQTSPLSLKKKAMTTIASLLYLEPPLDINAKIRVKMIDLVLAHLTTSSSVPASTSSTPAKKSMYYVENGEEKHMTADTMGGNEPSILQSLQSVLVALLETQPSVESICQLIFKIEYWIVAKQVNERIYALETYKLLIKRFIKILRKGAKQMENRHLKHLGHYLATIIPRVTDSLDVVRCLALETIQMLLFIDQLLRNPGQEKPSEQLRSLNALKKAMNVEKVPETRLQKIYHLAEILCVLISASEMQILLPNLIRGVGDDDVQAALGTCKALQGIFKERAIETESYVQKLLEINLTELRKHSSANGLVIKQQLMSICILTREHFELVMEFMHVQRMPLDFATTLVFKALAADGKLQTKVIDYELGIINNSPITTDGAITKSICIATKALGTFFTLNETKSVVEEYYFQFFTTLITRLGTASCTKKLMPKNKAPIKPTNTKSIKKKSIFKSNSNKKSSLPTTEHKSPSSDNSLPLSNVGGYPVTDTIEAIHSFFLLAEELLLLTNMSEDRTWHKLSLTHNYELGLTDMINKWSVIHPKQCRDLFQHILPYFKKYYIGHRNSACVVLAELIIHCTHTEQKRQLLSDIIYNILPRIADNELRIRKQSLIGLGNISKVWYEQLNKTIASNILSSLQSAIEDKEEIICITAINSLILILDVVDESTICPILINICFRTRPFFNSANDIIRVQSFKMFGKLCKFGNYMYNESNFLDQIHVNMVSFVMHINDVNDDVSVECLNTFRIVCGYLKNEKLEECLANVGIGKSGFLGVVGNICPILVDSYLEQLPGYLQQSVGYTESRWGELRGNAALFSTKIIQCCPEEYMGTLDVARIVNCILKLMKSKNSRVRLRVAKSLCYLSQA